MDILRINGIEKQFRDRTPETLAELLDYLKINHATVVAQINDQIVERNKFAETKVYSHQSIELLRFVGGG